MAQYPKKDVKKEELKMSGKLPRTSQEKEEEIPIFQSVNIQH